jgi:glycosyltransferase involved in cell wall biosynthesis
MVVNRLAGALDRKRFRSVVCLFRPGWLKEQCESQGIETHVLQMRGMIDWQWIRAAALLVRQRGIALIHAHEFTGNTYGTLLAKLAGVPLIATVHGKNYYWEQIKRRLAYRLVCRLGTMVAVSEDLRRFVIRQVGVPERRIEVIYNGIEVIPTIGPEEARQRRTELGVPEGERIVGAVGNLYPVKGHKYLLETVPRVLAALPRTTFLIVGRGELESSLKREVERQGFGHRVRVLGFRDDVRALLAVMDVFALPSLSEGLPIALLEAMASGRPVVATNVGGVPELLVDGETGFLVPPRDSEALASRLIWLLKDGEAAKRLGVNGRKRVLQHFSLQSMATDYQRLYEECLRAYRKAS